MEVLHFPLWIQLTLRICFCQGAIDLTVTIAASLVCMPFTSCIARTDCERKVC
jgi:hypothetical protein